MLLYFLGKEPQVEDLAVLCTPLPSNLALSLCLVCLVDRKMRERLGTKLQVRQKTGFAFNFNLDEDLQAKDEAHERESFRSGFSSSDPALYKANTFAANREKDTEDVRSTRVDGLGIDLRESMSQLTVAKQKKKKPPGKRRRKGKKKGKGKCKGQGTVDSGYDSATQAYQDETIIPSTIVKFSSGTPSQPAGSLDRKISNVNPSSESGDVVETPQPITLLNLPSAGIRDVVPRSQSLSPLSAISRPPPGLTLESWKDPALTMDERRRRRFGRGVRNLVAIQRSCESRKGLPASSGELQAMIAGDDDRSIKSDTDRMRQMESLVENGDPTGSSVFAFGFDIGISFNGGS